MYLYDHVLGLLRKGTISAALPPCQAGKDGEAWDNPRQSRNGKVKLAKDSDYKYTVILVATGILDGDHIKVSKN